MANKKHTAPAAPKSARYALKLEVKAPQEKSAAETRAIAATGFRSRYERHDIRCLPFVRTVRGADGKKYRSFWTPPRGNGTDSDYEIGYRLAATYLGYRAFNGNEGPYLSWIVAHMRSTDRFKNPIEAGFLNMIDLYAMSGAHLHSAEQISAFVEAKISHDRALFKSLP